MDNELLYAAWELGELSYKLRNIQKKVRQDWLNYSSKSRKYYLDCTRRFGKSTLLCVIGAEHCIKNPHSRVGFYAPVKEGLRDYVVPIINQVYDDCPEELRPYLGSDLTQYFSNGSTMIFRGSNNQQHRRRRGNNLDLALIDEARDIDDLDNLIDSVIMPSLFTNEGRMVISSTPADTDDHPLYTYRMQAEKEGWVSKYTIMDCNKYDPKAFPIERINEWRRETNDEIAWSREYMAEWVKDPTKTIIPEWEDRMIVETQRDEFFPYYHKYSSMDIGVKDKTAVVFGYYDFRQAKLIIEDEFTLKDGEVITQKIADMTKMKEKELGYQDLHDKNELKFKELKPHEKMFRRIADNNNLILINDLNSMYALDYYPTAKDELPAMLNMVREWVRTERIVVNPNCRELIGCLKNAIWDKNKKDLARSRNYGHFDALMSLVYLVRNVDTHTNPIPKYFGKSWATHAIQPTDNQPQTGAYNIARVLNGVKSDRDRARDIFARRGQ